MRVTIGVVWTNCCACLLFAGTGNSGVVTLGTDEGTGPDGQSTVTPDKAGVGEPGLRASGQQVMETAILQEPGTAPQAMGAIMYEEEQRKIVEREREREAAQRREAEGNNDTVEEEETQMCETETEVDDGSKGGDNQEKTEKGGAGKKRKKNSGAKGQQEKRGREAAVERALTTSVGSDKCDHNLENLVEEINGKYTDPGCVLDGKKCLDCNRVPVSRAVVDAQKEGKISNRTPWYFCQAVAVPCDETGLYNRCNHVLCHTCKSRRAAGTGRSKRSRKGPARGYGE